MPRNKYSIQIELHLPESAEEMQAIQRIFSSTLCSCIAKKLENSNLTADEKKGSSLESVGRKEQKL